MTLVEPPSPVARQAPWKRLATIAAIVVVTAAIIATLGTKWLWGYWFAPPGLDPRVRDVATVIAVSDLSLGYAPARRWWSAGPFSASGIEFRPEEITAHITDRGVALPQTRALLAARPPSVDHGHFSKYSSALDAAVIGDRLGRGPDHRLFGEVMEFRASDGREYAFISVVSDGPTPAPIPAKHEPYLYCEFLLSYATPDAPPRMLSFRRFYFGRGDLASYGWTKNFVVSVAALTVLTAIAAGLAAAIRRGLSWRRWRRHRRLRGFAVETRLAE